MRLTMVTNRPGAPTARNRKPTRTINAAITACEMRVVADGKAASARNRTPSGHSTQPDLPKSVICSLNQRYQCGSCVAPRAIGASTRNIISTMTASSTAPAIAVCCGDRRPECAGAYAAAAPTSAIASTVLRQQRRSAACASPPVLIPFTVVIQFAIERNTVSRTGRPMLIL